MYLIVGLGNPGKEYAETRHNVGFMAGEAMVRSLSLPDFREKFSGVWTRGDGWGDSLAVLKPLTFMNLSGDSVQPACAFLKVPPANVIVVHDELDLAFADVRIKVGGGHAGHNGLRSIIQRLGTPDFVRGDVADYVLSTFDPSERAELPDVITRAQTAVQKIVESGTAAAMNAVNPRLKK
jgi:PTH1 family peptidyl-tRNA hydrolase